MDRHYERMIILNDGHIAINGTSKLGTYSTGILSVTADIGNTDQGITIKNIGIAHQKNIKKKLKIDKKFNYIIKFADLYFEQCKYVYAALT